MANIAPDDAGTETDSETHTVEIRGQGPEIYVGITVTGEITGTESFEGSELQTESSALVLVGPAYDAISFTGQLKEVAVAPGQDGAACADIIVDGTTVDTLCTDSVTDETREWDVGGDTWSTDVDGRTQDELRRGVKNGSVLGNDPLSLIPALLPGIGPLSSSATTALALLLVIGGIVVLKK